MTIAAAQYVRNSTYSITPDSIADAGSGNVINHTGFSKSVTALNSGSTPPVTKAVSLVVTMTAGAATIDLTSLAGDQGTVSGSGLKVQAMILQGKSPETVLGVTVAKGASNGYTGFGSAFSVDIPTAGAEVALYGNNDFGTVGSGSKTLDVSGTGTDALNVTVFFG